MITSYPSVVTSQRREGLEMKEEEKKGGERKEGGEMRGGRLFLWHLPLESSSGTPSPTGRPIRT